MVEISNSDSPHNFEEKKRTYFVRLARRYKPYYELHRLSGQTNRFKDKDKEGNHLRKKERWGDPTQHCLVELAAAEIFSDMLHLSSQDRQDLAVSALVHDAQKRPEIEKLKGVKDPNKVERVYKESKQFLLDHGVSPRVVELTGRVAHTSLPDFATLNADGSLKLKDNIPLVDMAMHYLDDITKGTDIVPFDARIDYLESVATTRYPYNEEGRAVWGGRTFFQAQREIGHMIEARLAEAAGIDDPKSFPDVINSRLLDKINKLIVETGDSSTPQRS